MRSLVVMVLSAAGSTACSRDSAEPLSYTAPAGTIDKSPISAFGDLYAYYPPEQNGLPYDPSEGLGAQVFADRLIGKHIAEFVTVDRYSTRVNDTYRFFPPAEVGPGPGMCQVKPLSVGVRWDGTVRKADHIHDREWTVFAVAGSVATLTRPWSADYRERLDAACKARRDMGTWYWAEPDQAYAAAQLADLVVAAAKRNEVLPFKLSCRPYPADTPMKSRCEKAVRRIAASINPRSIMSVMTCDKAKGSECLSIGIAEFPDQGYLEEEQWTLDVRYSSDPEIQISEVEVADTHLIIE